MIDPDSDQPGYTPDPSGIDVLGMIRLGYLPKSTTIDAMTGQPLWNYTALAGLFEISAVELARELIARGAVHAE
jgi:hypothetical protein